jgi:hypothetical protein
MDHIPGMTAFLAILLVLAMLGTLTVLGFGVATLLRGGDPPVEQADAVARHYAGPGAGNADAARAALAKEAPMVRLTRIYTRGGGAGDTSLGDGSRVPKHALRVAAYGMVDEANAAIGIARLHADAAARPAEDGEERFFSAEIA